MGDLFSNLSLSWLGYFTQLVLQNTLFLALVLLILNYSNSIPARFRYLFCVLAQVKLALPLFIPLSIYSAESVFGFMNSNPVRFFPVDTTLPKSISAENIATIPVSLSWPEILFFIWISGLLIYLFFVMIGAFRLSLVLRSAQPIGEVAKKSKNVRIYISDRISMPLTHLFFPRRIYVPENWKQLTRKYQTYIIQHELAHMQRYDSWLKLLQLIIQATYFFHPLVYILNKKMNLYREIACDDDSICYSQISHPEYSKFLTNMAENVIWKPYMYQSASAFTRKQSELYQRIKYQLEEVAMSSLSPKKLAGILLVLLAGIFTFSSYVTARGPKTFQSKQAADHLTVNIRVNQNNDIFIDEAKIAGEEFKAVMEKLTRGSTETAVIKLTFNPDVTMQQVFKIQQQLQELHLLRVNYTDETGNGLNLQLPAMDVADKLEKVDKKDILTLSIQPDGTVLGNNMVLDKTLIEKFIKENLKKNEYLIVAISIDPDTRYEDYISVLGLVKKVQANRVVINASPNAREG